MRSTNSAARRTLLLLALSLSGCATHRRGGPRPITEGDGVLSRCEETVDAHAVDYQHFTCLDAKDKRWDVYVRPATN